MLETMQPSTLALVVKWKIPSCSLVLAYPLYIGQHHSGYEICNSSTKIDYPFRFNFKARLTNDPRQRKVEKVLIFSTKVS